jgi:hypothetical protein
MDWKKEYKPSDLFRRNKAGKEKEGAPASEPPAPAPADAGAGEPSVWRKEVRVSDIFRRGKQSEREHAGPQANKPGWVLFGDVSAEDAGQGEAEPTAPPPASTPPAEQLPPQAQAERSAEPEPGERAPLSQEAPEVEPEAAGPQPQPEPPAAAPGEDAGESIWKKEIRISGLFRRGRKESEPVADVPAPESADQAHGEAAPPAESSAEAPSVEESVTSEAAAEAAEPADAESADAESAELAAEPVRPTEEPEEAAALTASLAEAQAPASDAAEPEREQESSAAEVAAAAGAAAVATGSASVWKKELKLSGLFGGGRSKGLRATSPRPGGPGYREFQFGDSNGAQPLPDVPLAHALNLLPREEVKVRSARPVLPYVGVGLLAALVVGTLAFVYLDTRSTIEDRQSAVEDLNAQIAALEAFEETTPQQGVALAGEALARATALSTALDGRMVWDRLLRDLSLTLPKDVWFVSLVTTTSVAAEPPPEGTPALPPVLTVTITGHAKSQEGVAQLLSRLGVLPELEGVQLQSSNVILLGEEEVIEFTLSAVLTQPAGAPAPTQAAPGEVASS